MSWSLCDILVSCFHFHEILKYIAKALYSLENA